MNETFVTFHGWAGSNVRHRKVNDVSVASLRVGVTPRLRRDGEWVDGETTWYSVTAWRTLADNLADSVHKGDPVIVHGRLRSESWVPEGGGTATTLQVDASLVGHDLTRGMTHFFRRHRPETDGTPATVDAATDEELARSVEAVPDGVDPETGEIIAA